jgi:hypothetical protein
VPGVTDDDWLVRLRKHLGIKFQKVEKIPPSEPVKPKPIPDPPLASSSTGSVAGSWERIEVYRQRVDRGEQIFNELDCKLIAVRQSHSHVG